MAGLELQDLGTGHAKTIQKQLLRLHSFGQRFPNSGTRKRLLSDFHKQISLQVEASDDLEVQVAIATDIAFVSPSTFPAIEGIRSHLISLASHSEKAVLWGRVYKKMARIPNNGYLEIWLQRVTKPKLVDIVFPSNERICQVVNGESPQLWDSDWISNGELKAAMEVKSILIADASEVDEVVEPEEVELFRHNSWVS